MTKFWALAGGATSGRSSRPATPSFLYHVTDLLHDGRVVDVPGHRIAPTVSAWLAELGAESPLVDDLARAAQAGDWAAVHAVGEHLCVDVRLAAA
ncbi:hypothetical protein ACX9NE_18550 [Mycobacterium sp. ML4]